MTDNQKEIINNLNKTLEVNQEKLNDLMDKFSKELDREKAILLDKEIDELIQEMYLVMHKIKMIYIEAGVDYV
jgi:predicted house-cleaning noncanonical NTP pyrophosphatase (MazG superfamily)